MKTTSSLYSSSDDPPPAYELQTRPITDNPFSDLHRIRTANPPTSPAFVATHHFQIETPGKPLLSPRLLPRPGPIPIFSVPGSTTTPTYLSLRPVPSSGSSYLVSPTPEGQSRPLSTTTYRFGPGRPPVVRLFCPGQFPHPDSRNPDHDSNGEELASFPLTSPRLFTRSITFSCPALDPNTEANTGTGTFTWRYVPSSSSLRQILGFAKSGSLLTLEYVPSSTTTTPTPKRRVFPAYPSSSNSTMFSTGSSSSTNPPCEEDKKIVAALLRNDEFRSRGTHASCAGNGGRVMVDSEFFSEGFSAGSSGHGVGLGEEERREMGTVMVLTTVLVMLKREVDRS